MMCCQKECKSHPFLTCSLAALLIITPRKKYSYDLLGEQRHVGVTQNKTSEMALIVETQILIAGQGQPVTSVSNCSSLAES